MNYNQGRQVEPPLYSFHEIQSKIDQLTQETEWLRKVLNQNQSDSESDSYFPAPPDEFRKLLSYWLMEKER